MEDVIVQEDKELKMSEYTTLAGYYNILMRQDRNRVTCPELEPGVYAHFGRGVEGEDPCLYYNLDFTPREYEYFDMFAQWFQVEWMKQRDGHSPIAGVRTPGISGPHLSCWQEPFKLSTFAQENINHIVLNLPNEEIRRVFFHYAQLQDEYMAPIPHCQMRQRLYEDELKINRTAIRALLIADTSGEDILKQFKTEHNINLCLQFGNLLCSFVEKSGEIYYRPIGRDYYVKIVDWGKKYYKPTPILQVLSSITDIVYGESGQLMVYLNSATYQRWLSRKIDGYFIAYIPSRPHIAFDEPQYFLISYYPFNKNPLEARPVR